MDTTDRALLERLDERTERIIKVLEGNGKAGLVDRVDNLESDRDKVKGLGLFSLLGGITGLLSAVFHFLRK